MTFGGGLCYAYYVSKQKGKTMFVKELTKGQRFTTPETRGTVYVAESVRLQDGYAFVTYMVEGTDVRSGYPTRPLSTVTPV